MPKFGQYFATDVWLRLCSWILVKILNLGLVKILKFKFKQDADVWILKLMLDRDSEDEIDQDLCLNLWYELNLRVRCAFGNAFPPLLQDKEDIKLWTLCLGTKDVHQQNLFTNKVQGLSNKVHAANLMKSN